MLRLTDLTRRFKISLVTDTTEPKTIFLVRQINASEIIDLQTFAKGGNIPVRHIIGILDGCINLIENAPVTPNQGFGHHGVTEVLNGMKSVDLIELAKTIAEQLNG
jgi:hypothetical protein